MRSTRYRGFRSTHGFILATRYAGSVASGVCSSAGCAAPAIGGWGFPTISGSRSTRYRGLRCTRYRGLRSTRGFILHTRFAGSKAVAANAAWTRIMNPTRITPEAPEYPASLGQRLDAPPTISALGNLDLLQLRPLGLFCSIRRPGDVILRLYDAIRALRDAGVPMSGGFHSPMEKECLRLLLRGTQPVLVCPGRRLDGMRIPGDWKAPLAENRLLVLSPFDTKIRRTTGDTAHLRNLFVAALAGEILVAYAAPGGKTEAFVRHVQAWGNRMWTLPSRENQRLLGMGLSPLTAEAIEKRS